MQIRITDTLKKLLILYVGVFIIQHSIDQFMGGHLFSWFALIPLQVLTGKFWQLLTYSFLHVDVMHLLFNGLVLAFVGSDLDAIWGSRKFLSYYFFCTIFAGVFYLLIQLIFWNQAYLGMPMVGASGGIYGLLLAYSFLFPDRELLLMMLFPIKAKQFVWILAGIEFLQALYSGQGGLSAVAHLSGMGAGFLFLWLQAKGIQISKRPKKNVQKKRPANHLRLVKRDDEDEGPRGPKTWH